MDRTDAEIIGTLQLQGRISMKELGAQVGLSQPAVTERVRKLEERGMIDHYSAVVSPAKIGRSITAYLMFLTKDCEKLVEFCRRSPELTECHRISGQYNFLLKVVTESLHTLELFTNACGKYGDSVTLVVMSTPIENQPLLPVIAD
ncbi:Lrp/AsnC family transcriptional regulator [Saccharibacillus sp. CPCC 101409]|uniref:Lrp/AsnC family transcriptional regulator n=1 Tax=Saccharibacillus sp. CPCC 101409 TaxID=3058041 RepID=UPI002670DF9C|nr:Lrp/AsnC family transcriptional regulator [Saccharibacillus sp. CPCC 101409]MDO3413272.1 Lrp/AsnC family transcriptional regulator [Saccharibacillus sp. CPCC 101409]